MRNIIKSLFILLLVFVIESCNNKQGKQISAVIPIADNKPDSALSILNKIDRTKLSDRNLALYSLVYTIAQDKSGLDVDNDSLLRNAYNWYHDKPTDSLYAKCEYYMGKYYSLNDSSEKALACYSNSIKASQKYKENYTLSLALLHASVVIRVYDQDLAIKYAISADSIYNNVKGATIHNKVYNLLNLAECYSYKQEQMRVSIGITHKAIGYAKMTKDSDVIADAYQDLSVFYEIEGSDSALFAAKRSFAYRTNKDASTCYALT